MIGGPYGAVIGGVGGGLLGGLSGGKNKSGGKGGDAPTAPDFNAAVENQAISSKQAVGQQTQANRPDQSNAFGATSTWEQGPGGWTQNSSFGGPLGSAVTGLEGQAAANAGQPAMTGEDARTQAINGAYGQATSRLDPQWSQNQEQLQTQLANQGLDPSSEAYQNAMGNFSRSQNDAYTSAMNSAIGQGTAAQATTFGENQAAQMQPYQQLGAIQGLGQQQATPYAGQAQATQYLPAAMAAYQGALQTYGIQQQGKNSSMSGLGGLAPMLGQLGGGGGGSGGSAGDSGGAGFMSPQMV
jgi:hypothetical protein